MHGAVRSAGRWRLKKAPEGAFLLKDCQRSNDSFVGGFIKFPEHRPSGSDDLCTGLVPVEVSTIGP